MFAPVQAPANPRVDALLDRRVEDLFRPNGSRESRRVGAELELLTYDMRAIGGHGVVPAARLRGILASDAQLSAEARFSLEPGGQLELSPTPSASARLLADDLRSLVARTRTLLENHGIGLAAIPVDPWRTADDLELQTPSARYLSMQRHFDVIGPAGRQMMRRTASFQICLDLYPGLTGRRQWLLANLAGPALAAAFTRPTASGSDENRLSIWQSVDPSRTGRMGSQVEIDQPARAYAAFARLAEAIPIDRDDGSVADLPFRLPLGQWISRGLARPDAPDIDHHLSTLFPPVRPRRYLEIRYIDAQPDAWLDVPVTLFTTLLYDASARDQALEVVGGEPTVLADWWSRAAADPADHGLRHLAVELLAIGARRARALEPGSLPSHGPDLIEEYATRLLGKSGEIGTAA